MVADNAKAIDLPWINLSKSVSICGLYFSKANTNWATVATILIQLDPGKLSNPDLDIRYLLPDMISDRSGGRIVADGYDYVGESRAPCLVLFLKTDDATAALPVVIEVLQTERVLDNDLSELPVAIEDGTEFRVVYPPDFHGTFHRSAKT
jgi:hypothetical protein